jgi:cytidylate kinase
MPFKIVQPSQPNTIRQMFERMAQDDGHQIEELKKKAQSNYDIKRAKKPSASRRKS